MSETIGAKSARTKKPYVLTTVVALCLLGALLYSQYGFYSIQPIGAAPEGGTVIVWRDEGEPFFNSADALCLEKMGAVSLMCRALAFQQAPTDRIILRLPYMHWAYLQSTGGREFDR